MLGSYEHRLVRVLERATPTLTRGIRLLCSLRGPMTLTPIAERLTVCLLYTSDAADDMQCVDLGGRRIIKKITGT